MANGTISKPLNYEFNNKFTDVALDDANNVPIGILSFRRYNSSTKHTPYTEGLTGSANSGGIISFRSSANYGAQVAFPNACEFLCIRNCNYDQQTQGPIWSKWKIISPDS